MVHSVYMSNLEHKRHTLAHLLAAAVLKHRPDAKRAIGPAIDDGFYFDFEFSSPLREEDLPAIEEEMRKILPTWTSTTEERLSVAEAKAEYPDNPYKHELIDEFSKDSDTLSFYRTGEYRDLCRGGHIDNPAKDISPDSFKLDRVAGAYWRGDEKNQMLTRVYGLAFDTKAELDAYLNQREEAKKRDHRKLGKELGLFTFSELVGAGLPLYTPKGTILREELASFSEKLQKERGFEKVWIPHITKIDLYKKSGHWDKFGDELMLVKSQESNDEFALKPMNCPHHTQIYASEPRSYRDLPVRFMETTTCYRDEKTGELSGLTRVRSLTQDDGHIFCRPDQVEAEFESIMSMIKTLYSTLGMEFKARLSFSDPNNMDKYLGDRENWKTAEESIEKIAKKLGLTYEIAPGEAAFYGPKIDIMVIDALGREWQCATQQLDFVQPARFELEYTDSDGSKKTPVMIHKALLGTIDRFLGVYIEHTAGNFPLWLSPIQARVLPVSEKHAEYAREVMNALKAEGLRAEMDDSSESLGKRIRNAKMQKAFYVFVVGEKEVAEKTVTIEGREGSLGAMSLDQAVSVLREKKETKG